MTAPAKTHGRGSDHIGVCRLNPDAPIDRLFLARLPDGPPPTGMILTTTRALVPVNEALTGMAYLRRLAHYRRRAKQGLPLFSDGPAVSTRRKKDEAPAPPKTLPRLPFGMRWDELRTWHCARCRRVLLGPSSEHVRGLWAKRKLGPRSRAYLVHLPPPTAAVVRGRPYCDGCLDLPVMCVVYPQSLEKS